MRSKRSTATVSKARRIIGCSSRTSLKLSTLREYKRQYVSARTLAVLRPQVSKQISEEEKNTGIKVNRVYSSCKKNFLFLVFFKKCFASRKKGLTPEIGTITQFGFFVASGQYADPSVLNEVHLTPNSSFTYDEVSWLKHLEPELGQHCGHKVGISVGKQRHVCHQVPAVKADYLLYKRRREQQSTRCAGGRNK